MLYSLILSLMGCGSGDVPVESGGKPAAASPQAGDLGAQQILRRLLETYRQAKSYSDQAVVRLHYVQERQPQVQEWKSAVRFQRPNLVAVDAFQATIRCDGRELKARIEDEPTGNIDGQVLVRPAPQELALKDLASDPLLYDIITSQIRRQPIQLELLLESGGLAAAFGQDIACRRLEDDAFDGRDCFRVEVPSPGGEFVFWVDQQDYLLRRLDYPAQALIPELAQDATVSELALWAEIRSPRLNAPLDAREFDLEVPSTAKRMKTFVVPPPPLGSKLFGQRPAPFWFTTLTGDRLASEDLLGKVAILVWYRDHVACQATLGELAKLHREFAEQENVAIYAVSTDPTTYSHADLQQVLKNWNAEMPLVRDLEAFGDSVFEIASQPTIVVLDPQGCLQIFQARGNPEIAAQLTAITQRLLAGEDVAAEIATRARREQDEYQRLVAAGGPEPQSMTEVPETAIKSRSEPARLKLTELWTCRDLEAPGNVCIVRDDSEPRLFVCDGVRTIAELDHQGQVVARHALDLPVGAAVTYLRTGLDAEGRRWFAGSAPLAPQLFLFDDKWQRVLTYPEQPSSSPICDVQLANLDGDDGLALYVGFVDDAGLQAVSLTGKARWSNKVFPNVVSIAVAPPADDLEKPKLLLTGEDGTILGVNRFGNEEPRRTVGKKPIARIAAARFGGARQAPFIGISGDLTGTLFAVGIDAQLRELWSYPLPPAIHQVPIEPIASGSLLRGGGGQWIFAAPDGSIHVVSDDGRFTDTWNYGAALTGIGATEIDGQPVLIVSSSREVTAWTVK